MAVTETKRSKITPEHKAEADALLKLWNAKQGRRSQTQFGEHYGLGIQANVGHYLHGRSALNVKAAAAFAQELGCEVADFSPRVAAMLDSLSQQSPLQPRLAGLHAPIEVNESQWQMLQDFEMLMPEDQNAIRKTLREKAAYVRKVFEQMARRHNLPIPATDSRVEETFGSPPPPPPKQTGDKKE